MMSPFSTAAGNRILVARGPGETPVHILVAIDRPTVAGIGILRLPRSQGRFWSGGIG